MTRERLKQRITYLVEHGGVLERETEPISKRLGYLIVALTLLELAVDLLR